MRMVKEGITSSFCEMGMKPEKKPLGAGMGRQGVEGRDWITEWFWRVLA